MKFKDVNIGQKFIFDGELFGKTADGKGFIPPKPESGLAWSIHNGVRYKEWSFNGNDQVKLVGKITIEKLKFDDFLKNFKKGSFGTQRLGQAFYDQFKLDRMTDQSALNNIYAKDGDHAIKCIHQIVEFS